MVLSIAGVAKTMCQVHKPSQEDEMKRIRDAGGFVIHNRVMGELAVSHIHLFIFSKNSHIHRLVAHSVIGAIKSWTTRLCQE